jgi:inhibitor of KinA
LDKNYHIFCLGDSAATIELGAIINEELNNKILAMQAWLQVNSFDGLKDIIVAYSSLTILYDPAIIRKIPGVQSPVFDWVKQKLSQAYYLSLPQEEDSHRIIRMPVCYEDEFGIDMSHVSASQQLSREDIINIHTAGIYRVFMIGFLPGFPYMATVDERLVLPRKPKPVPVTAGSVGIAGSQTGIYPFNSPGGWNIIGKTPVRLFNPDTNGSTLFRTGDRVQFYPINLKAFHEMALQELVNIKYQE